MRVLIVEDDGSKSQILQRHMERTFNANVSCVTNEQDARNKLVDSKSYDVVLLDMTLPNMVERGNVEPYGGLNILSLMENNYIFIPVIVVTSYFDFKQMSPRKVKELFWSKNNLFQNEIDYETIEMVEDLNYLDRLHQYMSYVYCHVYFASIEFSYHNEVWKKNLGEIIGGIMK